MRLSKALFIISSRRRHTRWNCDWSSDVCSSDLIGTSFVHLCAELFETTGMSFSAYLFSNSLISSLDASIAENTKSTLFFIFPISATSETAKFLTLAGISFLENHLPSTASEYFLQADLGEAASAVTSNHGCLSNKVMNLWPTMPVAPNIPHFSFFIIVRKRYSLFKNFVLQG